MSEELSFEANGIRFHALADGPAHGPLVLLLHGFPELSRSWRHQLPALAQAGYRVVAPDLRGYGRTGKKGPFDLATLSADVAGIVRALGREKAVVAGHDWGGAVAWGTAFYHPEVVDRLVVLNCPHPAVMAVEVATNPRQLLRSWYMFFFQLPWLPEWLLSRDRASFVARALRGGSFVRDAWPREELEPYREAFSHRESAAAAIGYYRAGFRQALAVRRRALEHPITAKTLILWGARDAFLGQELLRPDKLRAFFAPGNAAEVRLVPNAGHFVQNEAPDAVNAALLDWLGNA